MVGNFNISPLTEEGRADALYEGTPTEQKCLQWHSVCVAQVPENTTVLASSDICRVQAMRVGECAWSMQYHVEIEPDTVDNWGAVPAYKQALVNTLGENGIEEMKSGADANMTGFLSCAETLYKNFMRLAR